MLVRSFFLFMFVPCRLQNGGSIMVDNRRFEYFIQGKLDPIGRARGPTFPGKSLAVFLFHVSTMNKWNLSNEDDMKGVEDWNCPTIMMQTAMDLSQRKSWRKKNSWQRHLSRRQSHVCDRISAKQMIKVFRHWLGWRRNKYMLNAKTSTRTECTIWIDGLDVDDWWHFGFIRKYFTVESAR